MTHSLQRTSPKGVDFIGFCTLCGKDGLTMSQANETCDNVAGKTREEAFMDAVIGDTRSGE